MLSIEDLGSGDFDTLIVTAPDAQGRLFGRRVPLRKFLEDPEGYELSICTCALAWDIVQGLEADVPFAGWHTGWHDFVLRPDLPTLRPYPGAERTAIVMADVHTDEGGLLELAPRTILRRQVERARAAGYRVLLGSELEFYLFHDAFGEARRKGFRELQPTTLVRSDYGIVAQGVQEPFIASIRRAMDGAGIPIDACQAEYGFGQWEVNLEHADALEMADRHAIYKAGVKELAFQAGMSVTFMAKPFTAELGSSCHFHCSLADGEGAPVFPGGPGARDLSQTMLQFVGGLMEHMDETTLFFAPYVNSYKRHAGEAAGGTHAWGFDNRTVTLRVVGRGKALRVEHRLGGADLNPYLGAAALIAAGLDGMQERRDPGTSTVGNAYLLADLGRTPRSLGDAIGRFEGSAFVHESFGKDTATHYAALARVEWDEYLRAVTDWEVGRAFEHA